MPIKVTCPECDHAIKAPDEMAGRRVKCPSCKAVLTVPSADVTAGAPPSRPSAAVKKAARPSALPAPHAEEDRLRARSRSQDPDDDDRPVRKASRFEDDEEERPRQRRGRREEDSEDRPARSAKSNKGLMIGLIAGGGALLIGAVVLVILLYSSGDSKQEGAKGGAKAGPPPMNRALDNDLKQIGFAYHAYLETFRKGPGRAEDLFPFLEGPMTSPSQALSSGRFVFFYNVRITDMLEGSSNTILAYESNAPTGGGLVLHGDGTTANISADEFMTRPKAAPRK